MAPILIGQSDEYYDTMFRSTNGLLIPGGGVSILDSGYAVAGKRLWDLSMNASASDRADYPIWGTCLGFEMLASLSNDDSK